MNDASSGWRDKRGLSRPEREKAERAFRLRQRFTRITRLYEAAIAQRKIAQSWVLPLCAGLAGGCALYFLLFH